MRKLSVMNTGGYLFVVIVGSFIGYMISAYLADALGRKRTLIIYAVCSFVTVWAYTYLPISNSVMLVLGFPLGFFASGAFSPIGAFFTELFPSRVRGSGQGFSYNCGTRHRRAVPHARGLSQQAPWLWVTRSRFLP